MNTGALAVSEGGATATFTVVLTGQPESDVTLVLKSTNEREGKLDTSAPLVFTHDTWDESQTITVTGVDDPFVDGAQVFSIALLPTASEDMAFAGLDAEDISVSNADNDTIGLIVSPPSGIRTTESGDATSLSLALSAQPTADVRIDIDTSNPDEGNPSETTVIFHPAQWSTPHLVDIRGADDRVLVGERTYAITLRVTSADAAFGALPSVELDAINGDNDVASISVSQTQVTTTEGGTTAWFDVWLTSEPLAPVTVDIASSNPQEARLSTSQLVFRPEDYEPRRVTVTGVDDDSADGGQSYTITFSPAVSTGTDYSGRIASDVLGYNVDNDTAGVTLTAPGDHYTTELGGTAPLILALASRPTADVTFQVVSMTPDEGVVTPSSVTFTPATWSMPRSVTVTGVADNVADGDKGYSVHVMPAVSADPAYSGHGETYQFLINADSASAGVGVNAAAGLFTDENHGTATFQVWLQQRPTGTVTIPISTSLPGEAVASPATLTFGPGDWNAKWVTVTGVDDHLVDGDHMYKVVLGPARSAYADYAGIDPDDVDVRSIDDDSYGLSYVPSSGAVSESGTTVAISYTLNTPPSADVILPLSSSDTSEGILSTTSLTFTAANWNLPHVVTVTGVDDALFDGPQMFYLRTAPLQSADPNYDGWDWTDVPITNADNDVAVVGMSNIRVNGIAPTGTDIIVPVSLADTISGKFTVTFDTVTPGNALRTHKVEMVGATSTWASKLVNASTGPVTAPQIYYPSAAVMPNIAISQVTTPIGPGYLFVIKLYMFTDVNNTGSGFLESSRTQRVVFVVQ